jgi:hypothetical protein
MAMRGIAPLCIFCIICIICIISGGIRGDAASGGVVSVCWWESCANADAAGTIATMLVAQRTAIIEANFIARSFVAKKKNMKLIRAAFETWPLDYDVLGSGRVRRSAMNWSNSALSLAVRRRDRKP